MPLILANGGDEEGGMRPEAATSARPSRDESQPLRQGLCCRKNGSLGSLAQWDVNSTLDGSTLRF